MHRLSNHIGLVGSELALQRTTAMLGKVHGYVHFKTGLYRDEMQQPMTI